MPGERVSVLLSPVVMHRASFDGVISESIDSAAFGPTPEIEVSCLNACNSAVSAKPNRSIASSRTFSCVKRRTSPLLPIFFSVFIVVRQA